MYQKSRRSGPDRFGDTRVLARTRIPPALASIRVANEITPALVPARASLPLRSTRAPTMKT